MSIVPLEVKDLLSGTRVSFSLHAASKEEVIDELIEMLYQDGKISDRARFKAAVLQREAEFSTAVGFGVAIPHGKDDSVLEPAVAFGVSKAGIDYQAADGGLSHLFFLIAAPVNSGDTHLRVLISISRKLMHGEVREALMNAATYEEVLKAFA